MSIASPQARHEREVLRIAEEYRSQGFEVKVEPPTGTLPSPLQGYSPDVFATRGDESHVVEVKVTSKRRDPERWAAIARAVEQIPGWRFHLVLVSDEPGSFTPPSREDIAEQLLRAQLLVEQGDTRPAMLLAWALFEGAARRRLGADGDANPARTNSVSLVKRLVQLGYLEQTDVPILQELSAVRSRLAHGFTSDAPTPDSVHTVCTFASRLLDDP